MLPAKLLGFITMAAALAFSAAPAAAQGYTMFLPDGNPVRAAQSPTESFMDYTDDSCIAFGPTGEKTPRGLATRSGGEVCSDFTVDHPIFSNEDALAGTANTLMPAEGARIPGRLESPSLG
jgi:hypothetical protein